jgi:uncharacterized membrane protein YkvA (DUF1232 family)
VTATRAFGRSIAGTRFFNRLKNRAVEYIREPDKLIELIGKVRRKAAVFGKNGALAEISTSLMALVRLVRAYAKGEYRDIAASRLVLIVAALLYFLIPTDVIPDFVVGVGLLDDVAVLGWVIKAVKDALDAFLKWESSRSTPALASRD